MMSASNNGIWEGKENVNLLFCEKLINSHLKIEKIRSKPYPETIAITTAIFQRRDSIK